MRFKNAAVFGLAAGTLTAGLAAGFAAPATAATASVIVTPGQARPGQQITLQVTECQTDGVATSDAFSGNATLDGAEEVEGRAGLATIGTHTAPGTYQILVHCGDINAVGRVVVLAGSAPTPHGGADTGLGGGAGEAQTVLLAAGGFLLAGAAGAGVMAARRRDDTLA